MPQPPGRSINSLLLACALTGCLLPAAPALGRQDPARPPEDAAAAQDEDEVVRVEAELIQTGVMVFDKSGKFVEGLGQDDFELTVEGRPTALSFFERVVSAAPAAAAAPARGGAKGAAPKEEPAPAGGPRTVIFFADDLHLSPESRHRARALINHFIDNELTDEDTAAVVSSSGRVGFLQQFTDNHAVLREAAARIGDDKGRAAGDRLTPPMTEYEAMLIDRYDRQVTEEFAAEILKESLAWSMDDAIQQARSRASNLLQLSAIAARNTYSALEQTVRRSAQLPGRKVVILISDGFLLDTGNTNSSDRLRRVTDAAARANAVVYTFDAKGLDATPPNKTGSGAFRVQAGERFEMQDPLNAIAEQTGGRFIRNRNDMRPGLSQALAEASRYYLLAWRPDPEVRGKEKFRRVEVRVKGRPELTVRLQNGYLEEDPKAAKELAQKAAAKSEQGGAKNVKAGATAAAPPLTPEQEQLRAALNSVTPKAALPTSLSANYLEGEGGPLLAASVRVEGSAVSFTREGGVVKAAVDVVTVVYDSKGKAEATDSRRLALSAPESRFEGGRTPNVYYNYQAQLPPGLHQVRVATRDVKTGQVGSAAQWVEIPDLSKRKLALSGLLLAEARPDAGRRLTETGGDAAAGALFESAAAELSVDRRLASTSSLRYLVFIYNASRGGAAPDVTLQTQIFRAGRAVVTAPPARVKAEGQDSARLAYAAEVALEGLPPGRYTLRVTVNDRAAKSTAAQRINFVVR